LTLEDKKQKGGDSRQASSAGRRKQKDNDGGKKGRRDPGKTILMWLAITVAVIFALRSVEGYGTQKELKLTYSQFQEILANPEIKIVEANIVQKGLNRAVFYGEVEDPSSILKIKTLKKNVSINKNFVVNLPFIDSEMLSSWKRLEYSILLSRKR
jgi:hypothetical protein